MTFEFDKDIMTKYINSFDELDLIVLINVSSSNDILYHFIMKRSGIKTPDMQVRINKHIDLQIKNPSYN